MTCYVVGRVRSLVGSSCSAAWTRKGVLPRQGRLMHQLSITTKSHISNQEVCRHLYYCTGTVPKCSENLKNGCIAVCWSNSLQCPRFRIRRQPAREFIKASYLFPFLGIILVFLNAVPDSGPRFTYPTDRDLQHWIPTCNGNVVDSDPVGSGYGIFVSDPVMVWIRDRIQPVWQKKPVMSLYSYRFRYLKTEPIRL